MKTYRIHARHFFPFFWAHIFAQLFYKRKKTQIKTLQRGTTDPEIDSLTWIKFSNNMAPLALVANLTTRWRQYYWLQIWPLDDATFISCKVDHQLAPLALVFANLATRWCHLHWLQIWPLDGTTCISYKFSHQVESLALVAKLSTRWRHLH